MNYWHMQLHPNNLNWGREKELLKELSLIGIGDEWDGGNNQINNFIKDMGIGDIVLIRKGSLPIALVQVDGDVIDNYENDFTKLDWFRYRRKIKVLDFADSEKKKFPQSRGTLERLKNKNTKSYKFIQKWHQKISPSYYKKQIGLKINNIFIEEYKIIKSLNLDLNESITILAGVNGTGKTTILEFIKNFTSYIKDRDKDKSEISLLIDNELSKLNYLNMYTKTYDLEGHLLKKEESFINQYYNKHIFYFSIENNIINLKELFIKYKNKLLLEEDLKPSELFKKIREQINSVFQDLDIFVEFYKVDENDNIFFKNKYTDIENILIDKLSSGEKTLLSKVIYFYIKNIKDSIILIDEPELSLHPTWQNKVLKLYENYAKENNCQIIIATHSPHIIGSAKNEYLRILKFNNKNRVEVINDVVAYGRDIKWVLEEVMGTAYTREKSILDKLSEIQILINNQNYDKAEEELDKLESIIGSNDSEILALRNDLAFERINFEED